MDARGLSGGLGLLWTHEITVILQKISINHIDVHVYDDEADVSWRFTGFYGDPDDSLRYKTWRLLRELSTLSNKPWLCAGDFNDILSISVKSGGRSVSFGDISDFVSCLQDSRLSNLGYFGHPFTWSNNRKHPFTIRERLDRACATNEWIDLFPNYRVIHLEALNSDHSPICIELQSRGQERRIRRQRGFMFEAMWLKIDECAKIVEESWKPMLCLNEEQGRCSHLETCKRNLRYWSKLSFKGVSNRISKLRETILSLKKGILSDESCMQIKELSNELNDLSDKEEMMWSQRGKAHWMREGD